MSLNHLNPTRSCQLIGITHICSFTRYCSSFMGSIQAHREWIFKLSFQDWSRFDGWMLSWPPCRKLLISWLKFLLLDQSLHLRVIFLIISSRLWQGSNSNHRNTKLTLLTTLPKTLESHRKEFGLNEQKRYWTPTFKSSNRVTGFKGLDKSRLNWH